MYTCICISTLILQDRAELHAGTTKIMFLSQPCHCVVHNDKEWSHSSQMMLVIWSHSPFCDYRT